MAKRMLSILLALVLVFGSAAAARADYRSPEQIAQEAAEKAAAMQAEAEAEIAARGEEPPARTGDEEIDPDEKAAAMQAALSNQPDWKNLDALAAANPEVEARRKELEQRYGILIRYDIDADGQACIGTGALSALDTALSNLTPSFVRQVSSFCKAATGKKLCYSFIYSPYQRMGLNIDVLGSFDPETSTIEIYLPAYGNDVVMGGESPLTYLHEFGHAFHQMAMEEHGEAALKREWTALNGSSNSYTFTTYPLTFDGTVWISAYASTRYDEDFCEVFAHSFLRVKAGQGFQSRLTNADGTSTILGRKVAYLEKLLSKYLDNSAAVVENFRRVHTTPEVFNYKGYQFSGDYLQFSGCPYPRYVLRSLLSNMEVEAAGSVWITEIGGWEVTTTTGALLIVFPGGTTFTTDRSVA